MRRWAQSLLLLTLLLSVPQNVRSAVFPDVPDGYIYQEPIEFLVGLEVINGNPDGNFYPERSVNRAEMLKMAYLSGKLQPDPSHAGCFSDVVEGSWYEIYVCDAAARGFVQGYSDGFFRPESSVNRVEAIKMLAEVYGSNVPKLTDEMREVVQFVDVSLSAWYTRYLYWAFTRRILPIKGQEGPRFYPDWPLLRAEAAAYIYNTWEKVSPEAEALEKEMAAETPPAPVVKDVVSPLPDPKPQEPQVQTIFNLPFPFDHDGIFDRKKPNLYLFELTKDVVAQIKVSVRAGYKGEITCRLYNLGDQGFSLEYYLGHEESGVCYITAALSPGSYQLQLQPDEKNVRYSVKATNGTGDGNDGFRQATLVTRDGVPKTASLLSNDYVDFFRFTVPKETEMMFSMSTSTSDAVSCIVYPLADVDLYGFSGPQCNVSYSYPEGTYMVGVYRTKSKASRQTYTIQLK